MSDNQHKLLVFGKRLTRDNPNKVGGVIVLFEMLVTELESNNINHEVVDLNWRNYPSFFSAYVHIVSRLLTSGFKYSHISLHGTYREFIYLAAVLVIAAKIVCGKQVSLRKFAGDFDIRLKKAHPITGFICNFALRHADQLFFETHRLVEHFKTINAETYWFSNTRTRSLVSTDTEYKKRFIYLGHVRPEKGIDSLLKIFPGLAADYSISIYGPLENYDAEKEFNLDNVTYHGVVESDMVANVLAEYDVLIMPTLLDSEGYPGVIIEAYSVGLPVIASNIGGIPEIVNNETGILFTPGNSSQLRNAILSFDEASYIAYHESAKKKFNEFDSEEVTRQFISAIKFQ